MRILIEYRRPTRSHCEIAVFINGAVTGVLILRQDELADFHRIIRRGTEPPDVFESRGNPTAWRGRQPPDDL